jgi:acyl-CoA thioesterase
MTRTDDVTTGTPEISARVKAMLANDRFTPALGIVIDRAEPGFAVAWLDIRDDMLNGFDIVHGGVVFALADTTFACACNEDANVTVAAGAEITYLRPARGGERLTATATRRVRSGRTGLYDVSITNGDGETVAEFRGRSAVTREPLAAD